MTLIAPHLSREIREPKAQAGPTILAIDPGPVRSGFVRLEAGRIAYACPDMLNGAVLAEIEAASHAVRIACETMQANYAATVGHDVIDTLVWIGRFVQARHPLPVILLTRQHVKAHVCNGNARANDAGVRQALIDRLGPPGTKHQPGPTRGVTSHAWSALAVAITAADELAAVREAA